MSTTIITESGQAIELPPEIVAESDAAIVEAHVAAERVKLGLPPAPPMAEEPVAAAATPAAAELAPPSNPEE